MGRMDKITTYNDRLKDYCSYRVASTRLAAKIRRFWNEEQGLNPIIAITEEVGCDGKPLYSIRGNIRLNVAKDTIELVPLSEFDNRGGTS